MENTKEHPRRFPRLRKNSAYNGQIPSALVGAIIGMLVGILPAVLWAVVFRREAYTLYALPPLAMYLFITLLKGCRDVRALIITAVLSLLGAYLTSVSVASAIYAMSYGMSVLSVPLVAVLSIGNTEFLPVSASGYALPLLFTVLGAALLWELLLSGKVPEFSLEE